MAGVIALIILIISIFGIGFIIYQKLPLLLKWSETPAVKLSWKKRWLEKKEAGKGKGFSFDRFLQKVLSKIRVFILKIENKTACGLEKLRQKSKKEKRAEVGDNYWEDIKNSKE